MRPAPLLLCLALLACCTALSADVRSTPTTVINSPTVKVDASANTVKVDPAANTVKIDPANNTVKAAQSGAWSVGVSDLPAVTFAAGQTVKIDPAGNAVEPFAHALQINPVAFATALGPGESFQTAAINCVGYKEVRAVLMSSAASASLVVTPSFSSGRGSTVSIGDFNFAAPAKSISDQSNFVPSTGMCMFTLPVMSPSLYLRFKNNSTTTSYTVSQYTWVYLVN